MPKILNYEYVKAISENFGIVAILNEDIVSNERITFLDPENYRYYMEFDVFCKSVQENNLILSRFVPHNPHAVDNIKIWELATQIYRLYEIPEKYAGVHQKLTFYDDNGYFYSAPFSDVRHNVEKGMSLLRWSKSNIYSEQNINLFLKMDDRNLHLKENQKYNSSKTRFLFYCDKCKEPSPFEGEWNLIMMGQGCPFCFGRKASTKNNMAIRYPEIAKDWDYEKNSPLKPEDCVYGSNKKISWICSKCTYEWVSVLSMRTCHGQGCPRCGRIKSGIGRSAFAAKRKNILDFDSELAKEWSDINDKRPEEYSFGSNKKVYWKCINGYGHPDYSCPVKAKTRRRQGCPVCSESAGEKKAKEILNKFNIKYVFQQEFDDCRRKNKLKFDFFLTDYSVGLEINGRQHYQSVSIFGGDSGFEKQKDRDKIKKEYCKTKNIRLIEISYLNFDSMEEILKKELNL